MKKQEGLGKVRDRFAGFLKGCSRVLPGLAAFWLVIALLWPAKAAGGAYLDSAHGSTSAGVKRFATSSLSPPYVQGNCAHCHEMHASIEGSEPAPVGNAAEPYALFYENFTGQTDNFCFKCHGAPSYQVGGIDNRSYSYRAGGWTADTLNDILEAFSYSSPASSHNLADISTFITDKWGYTSASNPCTACHNPHIAKRNKSDIQDPTLTAISLPTDHNTLWGDDDGATPAERMDEATGNTYQAPLHYTSNYEPGGTTTSDGSLTPDYNAFCLDCHQSEVPSTNTTSLNPNTTPGFLTAIDWDTEKHGLGDADTSLCGDTPYPSGTSGLGKALSCLDCHEPHGSPNKFLLRQEVNGATLTANIDDPSTDLHYLCDRCHKDDYDIDTDCQEDHYFQIHHSNTDDCNSDRSYSPFTCGSCHSGTGGGGCTNTSRNKISCINCHYHGSWVNDPNNSNDITPNYAPTTRTTF